MEKVKRVFEEQKLMAQPRPVARLSVIPAPEGPGFDFRSVHIPGEHVQSITDSLATCPVPCFKEGRGESISFLPPTGPALMCSKHQCLCGKSMTAGYGHHEFKL